MKSKTNGKYQQSGIYLIGGGIASLAAAVYLEKDAGVPGVNIRILEKDPIFGGALDGGGDTDKAFVVRGGRMHELHYTCYWDLLSCIPSFDDPNISVRDESFDFNNRFVTHAQARLLEGGRKLDVSSFGLDLTQQAELMKLTFVSEESLGSKRIEDWFDESFFKTNFWLLWTSMFAFQKWSSLAEMRRYMKRFIHLIEGLPYLGGVMRTKYNQYHSVIVPLQRYLAAKGVRFLAGKEVVDIDFDLPSHKKTATVLHLKDQSQINLGENDYVFITNGSITDATDNGAWDKHCEVEGSGGCRFVAILEEDCIQGSRVWEPRSFLRQHRPAEMVFLHRHA